MALAGAGGQQRRLLRAPSAPKGLTEVADRLLLRRLLEKLDEQGLVSKAAQGLEHLQDAHCLAPAPYDRRRGEILDHHESCHQQPSIVTPPRTVSWAGRAFTPPARRSRGDRSRAATDT